MSLLAFNWSAFSANVGQFILAFSILVVLHEMGHFLTARWFGCRVDKFYLFFNPWFSLWKKKIGDTEYGLGWVPLGGYVKIAGMIDESMDKEQMKKPAEPYEFRSKPAWQRLIIMLGGVTVNFLLALVLFALILFTWGEEKLPVNHLKYGLSTDSLATEVGLKDGDVITAVNDQPLVYLDNLPKAMMLNDGVQLRVQRQGTDTLIRFPEGFIRTLTKNQLRGFVAPRIPVIVDSLIEGAAYGNKELKKGDQLVGINNHSFLYYDEFDSLKQQYRDQQVELSVIRDGKTITVNARLNKQGSIGFYPKDPYEVLGSERKNYTLLEAIPAGITFGVDRLNDYVKGIQLLFTSKEHKVADNLGSVISIGKTFGGSWDWKRFWTMTALFSIILAFMNILPIPALDGGHALFTVYEMITGRKPSDKFMEYAQMVGMFLLLGLMVYAFGLDIWRLFR